MESNDNIHIRIYNSSMFPIWKASVLDDDDDDDEIHTFNT